MNRRQKIIISVTGIFIVLLLLVGLTYGYFLTKISGNTNSKSISVSTANLELVYGNDDGNVIGDGELIEPGKEFDAKTFTVTNEGNATTDYVVVIENATSTFKNNDFVYTLSCTSDGESCTGVDKETTYPINGGVLVANKIEVGKTHTYSFTLKYVDTGSDQSDDMNKTLTGKINIKDISGENPYSSDTDSLAYNIINNAITGKYGTTLSNLPLTTPGKGTTLFSTAQNIGETQTKETIKTVTYTTTDAEKKYFSYGDTYIYADYRHTISNKDESDIQATTLSTGYETLKGKYITSLKGSTNSTPVSTSSMYLYYVVDATSTTIKYKKIYYGVNEVDLYITYASSYEYNAVTDIYKLKDPKTIKYSEGYNTVLPGKYITSLTGDEEETLLKSNSGKIYLLTGNSSLEKKEYKVVTEEASTKTSKEKELLVTQDDYGTSYYYRGGIEDNYVNFAGMCWRIVRIEGDGSTKLILEDQSSECDKDTYTGNWSDGNKYNFGHDDDYNANFLNFEGGFADALKNFQKTKLNEDTISKLKLDNWCYDNNVTETKQETDTTYGNYINNLYGTYTRLETNKTPSLICSGTKINKYADNTDMYVGALTAEEVSFAGATSTRNTSYYLINKYTFNNSLNWFTISLKLHCGINNSPRADYIYYISSNGRINIGYSSDAYSLSKHVYESNYVRPAITLASGTQISTGNGTIENPYTIK